MGRRALKKVDPLLDLGKWLLEEDQLPDPFCAPSLFGRHAPLEIEVGSGKGLFMCRASVAHPERDFLGIEIGHKFARFAAAKLARLQVSNAKMVSGDGLRIFRERLPDETAAAVHVYFPDPWWKARHRKRRVMNEVFVGDIQRVLQPGGTLHFWTDVEEYFQVTLELLRKSTDLQGPVFPEEQPAGHDLDYRTHFERRMRMHDVPIYRSQFSKRA